MFEPIKAVLAHIQDIYYKRIKYRMPRPFRKRRCENCGKIAYTNMHHWAYAYTQEEVDKNPELALKHTSELCIKPCHLVADAITRLDRSPRTTVADLIRLRDKKVGRKHARVEKIVWRKEHETKRKG